MNILFIYTNIDGFHTDVYSFGLASIISVTKLSGYNAKVVIIEKEKCSKVYDEISLFKPQLLIYAKVIETSLSPWQLRSFNTRPEKFLGVFESSDWSFKQVSKMQEMFWDTVSHMTLKIGPNEFIGIEFRRIRGK